MGRNKIHGLSETPAEYAKMKGKSVVYCEACKKDIAYYSMNKHIQSKKHLENAVEQNNNLKNEKNKKIDLVFESLNKMNQNKFEDMSVDNIMNIMKTIDEIDKIKKDLRFVK